MNEIKSRLAANIRIAREKKKLSRPQLASMMKCHVNTIYQWESTERECPSDKLEELARVLMGGNWLWFYQHNEQAQSVTPDGFTPEEVASLKQLLRASGDGSSLNRSEIHEEESLGDYLAAC